LMPRLRFGPALLDERHPIRKLAETVDRDPHNIAGLRGIRLRRDERRPGEEPRADRQRVRRMQDRCELGRLARHVGDRRGPVEDRRAGALDRHADLRARDVDVPGEDRGRADRTAAVVDLRLGQEERVLTFDAPRAHVVAARECDDLAVRVRENSELRLRHVPRRVLADAHLAAVRNDAPPGGLEEELWPVALVDVLVDRLLRRLLDARLTASEIRDPGRPDLLRFGRRGELDLSRIELGADDRAETRANSIERQPKKCVEGQRIQIPKVLVAPQREKGPAFTLYAEERRGRDVERLHFPPRTPPSTNRPLPITKLDSSEARKSAAE